MINDIKSKIPFGKKGKEIDEDEETENETADATDPALSALDKTGATDISDMDEDLEVDEDEDDAPVSIVDKIKAKLASKKKTSVSDGTEIGDKEKNKKKINPVVLVVVIVALGIFVFYDEEPEVIQPPPLKKTLKVVKKDIEADKPTETDAPEPPAVEEPTVKKPVVTETPAETAVDEPIVTETPTEEPAVEEPAIGEGADDPVDDGPVTEDSSSAETGETTIDEPVVIDLPSESVESPTDIAPTSFDSVDGQVTDNDESSMTDKILEDLEKQVKKDQPAIVNKEYVAPPDYEYRGRGLVYNCAGKHWACVDGPSYKVCENNFSGTTYQKKTIECYPFNIYETKKGCELMQNRVVSSSAKTNFCKGN